MDQFMTLLPPGLLNVIGVFGFSLYVMNYSLLTLHKLTSHSALYFVINGVAASCVLISMLASFNLASALIQSFWIVISLIAIGVRLRRNVEQGEPQAELA